MLDQGTKMATIYVYIYICAQTLIYLDPSGCFLYINLRSKYLQNEDTEPEFSYLYLMSESVI